MFLKELITSLSVATDGEISLVEDPFVKDVSNYLNNLYLFAFKECGLTTGYYLYRDNYIGICIDLLQDNMDYDLRKTLIHEFLHSIGFAHPHNKFKNSISIDMDKTSGNPSETNPIIKTDYKMSEVGDVSDSEITYKLKFDLAQQINAKIKDGNILIKKLLEIYENNGIKIDIKFEQGTWTVNSKKYSPLFEVNSAVSYGHWNNNTLSDRHYKAILINHYPENKEFAKLINQYETLLKYGLTFQDIVDIQKKFQGCSKALEEMTEKKFFILEICGVDSVKIKGDDDSKCVEGVNGKNNNKKFSEDLDKDFYAILKKHDLLTPSKTNYKCDRKEYISPVSLNPLDLINFISDLIENNETGLTLEKDNIKFTFEVKDSNGVSLFSTAKLEEAKSKLEEAKSKAKLIQDLMIAAGAIVGFCALNMICGISGVNWAFHRQNQNQQEDLPVGIERGEEVDSNNKNQQQDIETGRQTQEQVIELQAIKIDCDKNKLVPGTLIKIDDSAKKLVNKDTSTSLMQN